MTMALRRDENGLAPGTGNHKGCPYGTGEGGEKSSAAEVFGGAVVCLSSVRAGVTDPHGVFRFYEPSSAAQTSMPAAS